MVPEAEIVPYQEADAVATIGAAGSSVQIRPVDPPRLQAWLFAVRDDSTTKTVSLKYRLSRLKFTLRESDLTE